MKSHPFETVFAAAILAMISLAILFALVFGAFAHNAPSGWTYPATCCSGHDCGRIAADRVEQTPEGFVVTVMPGEHVMVEHWPPLVLVVPYNDPRIRPSPDGDYHLCVNAERTLLCFFVGAMTG